jgi:PAS domain S-box-containing protein
MHIARALPVLFLFALPFFSASQPDGVQSHQTAHAYEFQDNKEDAPTEMEDGAQRKMLEDLEAARTENKNLKTVLVLIVILLLACGVLFFFEFRSRAKTAKSLASVNKALSAQQEKLTRTFDHLVESESKYRSLVENSPTGILLLSTEGKILEVNKRMLDILGSPGPEETRQINCLEYGPLKAIGLSDDLERCIAAGLPMGRRVNYVTKWGRNVHLNYSITPVKDKKEKVIGLILNVEDISESVRAERSRLESELKYRILVENSLQAMLIVQGGRVLFANSMIEEITGYSVDEIRSAGRRWQNLLIHPEDKRRSFKNVKDALDGNDVDARQVYKIVRKDGEPRIMETLGAVVDFHEQPAMLIVAIDITENTMSRNKLIESEKRMRELNAMKDKFFSIIAHDLKNPFSSIMGFSNLLNEAYDNFSEKQRKTFIKNICEASESTFKLLQNLLEWSRTQTGKIEFLPRMLDVEPLVMDNMAILKTGFLRKNINVDIQVPPGLAVFADENMIKLVIRNLLSNALKFTHQEGSVHVLAKTEDKTTVITVRDDGVGIQKEDLVRLFRIDDQLRTAGTEKESGSGLGLILCKEFVEQNKGRIWVQSVFGEGSSFSFALPASGPGNPK